MKRIAILGVPALLACMNIGFSIDGEDSASGGDSTPEEDEVDADAGAPVEGESDAVAEQVDNEGSFGDDDDDSFEDEDDGEE